MLLAPIEASWLLGLAGVIVACFVAVYIYHCKSTACFEKVSKCWCCQKTTLAKRRISKELVNAFSYDDELEVSSECDEDVMRHLQQRPQCKYTKFSSYLSEGTEYHHRPYNKLLDYDKHSTAAGEVFNGVVDGQTAPIKPTGALLGPRIVRQSSVCQPEESDHSAGSCYDGYYKQHRSANILKQQAIYASLALKNKSLESMKENTKLGGKDLISMAEKGRIGKQTSTEASSEAGSNEDSILIDKKTHILRRLKTASSETESTQSSNLPDFSPNTTISEPNIGNSAIKAGRLEASFAYDAPSRRICVSVIQACEVQPYKADGRVGVSQVYVQVLLLPQKKAKFRTKSKPIFCPIFNQTFTFNRISPDEIMNSGLRFRVYCSRHLIGESRLLFACMKPQQQETKLWFTLEPHKRIAENMEIAPFSEVSSLAHTDSTSSQSLHNTSPELLLGLSYNGVTGRLSVIIIKGSQFRSISTRAPDTFVKITLQSSSGQEIARSKTSVIRGQPNPHFKETFIFQVALFQLPDVRLTISAYNKRSIKRKELIGWITFGNNCGDEEQSHWNDMRDSKGEQVCRWHVLMQS